LAGFLGSGFLPEVEVAGAGAGSGPFWFSEPKGTTFTKMESNKKNMGEKQQQKPWRKKKKKMKTYISFP